MSASSCVEEIIAEHWSVSYSRITASVLYERTAYGSEILYAWPVTEVYTRVYSLGDVKVPVGEGERSE